MRTTPRVAAAALLAGLAWASPGLTDPPADEPIKDRASFFPSRKQQALKGTVVGVLLYDAQPVLSTEGRSGPPDQLCFSASGNSYRWVYVPAMGQPQITNLRIPVGEKGNGEFEVYPALDMARPTTVARWGITAKCTLVELEVNGGKGSPKGDSFVATKMKSVEGSKQYPLRTAEVIEQLRKRYAAYLKDQGKTIEAEMGMAQKKAIKDAKPTGPREQADLMYVTWLPDSERLVVRFRTKITDGQYTIVEGGGIRPRGPQLPGAGKLLKRLPPPPPPFPRRFKTGISFGIELGAAYEVNKEGKLVRTQTLPVEAFQHRLPPPPGPVGRPVPLPPPPQPPAPAIQQ
jgi:hypothetical protein